MRAPTPICLLALCVALACAGLPASAQGASKDPLFTFTPESPPKAPPVPPPAGNLEGPCGLAVASSGRFYVADHYHDAIDAFEPQPSPFSKPPEYAGQRTEANPLNGPCALATDPTGRLYAAAYHGAVSRYVSFSGARSTLDPGPATGVAADPATGRAYVDEGTYVSVYES